MASSSNPPSAETDAGAAAIIVSAWRQAIRRLDEFNKATAYLAPMSVASLQLRNIRGMPIPSLVGDAIKPALQPLLPQLVAEARVLLEHDVVRTRSAARAAFASAQPGCRRRW
jgi:hypothetical protein